MQRRIEQAAFRCAGGGFRAPCQRVGDFLSGRASVTLGGVEPTYLPGVTPGDLRAFCRTLSPITCAWPCPGWGSGLRGSTIPTLCSPEPETRSSAPVRILRNPRRQSAFAGLYLWAKGPATRGASSPPRWTGSAREWISTKPKNGGTAMNTKRLVDRCRPGLLSIRCSACFPQNLGLIKLTFESFPVLVASLMFGLGGRPAGGCGGRPAEPDAHLRVYRYHADVDSAQRHARPAGGPLRQKAMVLT